MSKARWVALLWLAVVASALAVVVVGQQCRALVARLAALEQEEHRLQMAWAQYLLEQSALASLPLVEERARRELGMRPPRPDELVIVVAESTR
ncbi:MAG: hypothetical protein KatS3mg124_1589 [Porticoccaceae bacterium]|nr:MAG: hypothetical protein KatS3mg124_1589 [Porticoccaceae bacterium]